MTIIPVVFLPPGNQWDQTMVRQIFDASLFPHNIFFKEEQPWPDVPGIVLVIPGRYWHSRIESDVEPAIQKYEWVLGIKTGDEEDLFDINKVNHPNIRWWVQTPRMDRVYADDVRFFGVGYSPIFANVGDTDTATSTPELNVFLSGQKNHPRREEFFDALGDGGYDGVDWWKTDWWVSHTNGFTQGISPEVYMECMRTARCAPSPSGPYTPDTFRAYEALQCHTVPIVDTRSSRYDSTGYWQRVHPDSPFVKVSNLSDLPGYIQDVVEAYPKLHNRCAAWWMRYKANMVDWMYEDLKHLGAEPEDFDQITVVLPTSPITSHPDTSILEETITSVRYHLPDSRIILTFDGVRDEQRHLFDQYQEYIRRALWLSDHYWSGVYPIVFKRHVHQTGMMWKALELVKSPYILYVEHDTPLVTDEPIQWGLIKAQLERGDLNVVRLYHEGVIPQDHEYLMHGTICGDTFTRTTQWSQRPHITTKAFYYRVMRDYFEDVYEKKFIEDHLYGKTVTPKGIDPIEWWKQWRIGIYTPGNRNFKRSYHTDGRAGEQKYD